MNHRTLILVIRRLSERARKADERIKGYNTVEEKLFVLYESDQAYKCRAKIDQLTEKYS